MELVEIYKALSDPTRLRLLQVLMSGPLCVCHFQAVLGEPQVKISKHLAYLRTRGLVQCRREGNWMIYALPAKPSAGLRVALAGLQECTEGLPVFKRDQVRLKEFAPDRAANLRRCCRPADATRYPVRRGRKTTAPAQ